jgi:tetratricopeptide (TPR) repeat protein
MKSSFFKIAIAAVSIAAFSLFTFGQEKTPSNNADCNSYQYQNRFKDGVLQFIRSGEIYRVRQYLERFIKDCPNSQHIETAKQLLPNVLENIAKHHFFIAKYYLQKSEEGKGGLKGAQARLREIAEKYPQFSKMDEVLFLLVKAYLFEKETDEAQKYYRRILDEFSFSSYVCEANKLFQ